MRQKLRNSSIIVLTALCMLFAAFAVTLFSRGNENVAAAEEQPDSVSALAETDSNVVTMPLAYIVEAYYDEEGNYKEELKPANSSGSANSTTVLMPFISDSSSFYVVRIAPFNADKIDFTFHAQSAANFTASYADGAISARYLKSLWNTNASYYTVTLTLKNPETDKWSDGGNSSRTFTFLSSQGYVTQPKIVENSTDEKGEINQSARTRTVGYTGNVQYFRISPATTGTIAVSASSNPSNHMTWAFNGEGQMVFSATNAGTYIMNVSTANTSRQYWEGTSSGGAIQYRFVITRRKVKLPRLIDDASGEEITDTTTKVTTYDGTDQIMKISADPLYTNAAYSTSYANTAVSWNVEDGIAEFSATDARTSYAAYMTLRDTSNYQWTDGTTGTKTFYFNIRRKTLVSPQFYSVLRELDVESGEVKESSTHLPNGSDTVGYSATERRYFSVSNIASDVVTIAYNFVNLAGSSSTPNVATLGRDINGGKLALTLGAGAAAGTYTISVTPTANYAWENNDATARNFVINVGKGIVQIPEIVMGEERGTGTTFTTTYTGSNLTMQFTPYSDVEINVQSNSAVGNQNYSNGIAAASYVADNVNGVLNVSMQNAGRYNIVLRLRNTNNFMWSNNGTTDITYTINVNPKSVAIPQFVYGSNIITERQIQVEYSTTTPTTFNIKGVDLGAVTPSASNTSYINYQQDSSSNDTLIATVLANTGSVGTFYIRLTLRNNVTYTYNYQWDDTTYAVIDYKVQVVKKKLEIPKYYLVEQDSEGATAETELVDGTATRTFRGSAYQVKFTPMISGQIRYSVAGAYTANWVSDTLRLSITNANSYTFTLSLYNTNLYEFDGSADTSVVFTFIIEKQHIDTPDFYYVNGGANGTDVAITGTSYTLQYKGAGHEYIKFANAVSGQLSIALNRNTNYMRQESWNTAGNFVRVYALNGARNTYVVTFTPTGNYCWTDGSSEGVPYTFTITRAEIAVPTIKQEDDGSTIIENTKHVEFNGTVRYLKLENCVPAVTYYNRRGGGNNYDMHYVWGHNMTEGYQENSNHPTEAWYYLTNANTTGNDQYYYFQVYLINDNYQWVGGGTSTQTYYLNITRMTLTNPEYHYRERVESQVKDEESGETSTVISYNDKRIDGESYTVTYATAGHVFRLTPIAYLTTTGQQSVTLSVAGKRASDGANMSASASWVRDDATSTGYYEYTFLMSGTYTITMSVSSNYCWEGGNTAAKTFTFIIDRQQIRTPELQNSDAGADHNKTVTYNTAQQSLVINYADKELIKASSRNSAFSESWDEEKGTVTYIGPTNVSSSAYSVTLTFNDIYNYVFLDNTVTQTYNLYINALLIAVPTMVTGDAQDDGGVFDNNGSGNCMKKTVTYSGSPITMLVQGVTPGQMTYTWNGQSSDWNEETGVVTLTATSYGTYTITFVIGTNYAWNTSANASDKANKVLQLGINQKPIEVPKFIESNGSDAVITDNRVELTFDGTLKTFTISPAYFSAQLNFNSRSGSLSYSYDNTVGTMTFSATNAGTYSFELYISNGNYIWADTGNNGNSSAARKSYTIWIKPKTITIPYIIEDGKEEGARIEGNTMFVTYSGAQHYMDIYAEIGPVSSSVSYTSGLGREAENWTAETNKLRVLATNVYGSVSSYSVRFGLSNSSNYTWADGTTEYKYVYFQIQPKQVDIPAIVGNGNVRSVTYTYTGEAQSIVLNPASNTLLTVSSTAGSCVYSWNENGTMTVSGTAVGSYTMNLGLINTSNYRWADGSTSVKDYRIVINKKPIDVPRFYYVTSETDKESGKEVDVDNLIDGNIYDFDYDGTRHKFRLTGILDEYISYTQTNPTNGDLEGQWDSETKILTFNARNVGYTNTNYNAYKNYQINVSLRDTANYVWNDGNNNSGTKYFYVTVNRTKITLPTIENNESSTNMYYKYFPFDNKTHEYTLQNVDLDWMSYATNREDYLELTELEGNKVYGKTLYSDIYGNKPTYTTVTLSDIRNTMWSDNSTSNKMYYLYIQRSYIAIPMVAGTNAKKYTGETVEFQIQNVRDSDWMTFTWTSSVAAYHDSVETSLADGVLTVRVPADVCNYTFTFALVGYSSSNAFWVNQSGGYQYYNKSVSLYVQKATLTIPSIDGNGTNQRKTAVYNYKDQTFDIRDYVYDGENTTNKWMRLSVISTLKFNEVNSTFTEIGKWDAEKELLKFTAMNVGTYTLRISCTSNTVFTDNSTYKDYSFVIEKLQYDSPYFVSDGVGTTTATVKTFTFNFADQTATLNNVIDNDRENGLMYYADTTSYSNGTAEDHRLKLVWDKEKGSLSVTAHYVGTYYVTFTIRNYENTRWSTTTSSASIRYQITVNKASLTIPSAIKTPLVDDESFSGNNKYVTYSGSFYQLSLKDINPLYMNWADTTNYTNKPDDHKATLTFDEKTNTIGLRAKYYGTYYVTITLKDTSNSLWITSSYNKTQTYTYALVIKQMNHAYPTFASGVSSSVQYNGAEQNFTIQNVVPGCDKYEVTAGTLKEVSWTKEGMLTLSAKEVGTYRLRVSIIDTENTRWSSYTYRDFTITINKKGLSATVTFSSTNASINEILRNGGTNWPSGVPVYANVNVTGFAAEKGEKVGLNVYMYNSNNSSITTPLKENGEGSMQYLLPTDLVRGTYYVYVGHAAAQDNYNLSAFRTKFIIDSDPTGFSDSDLVWQYSVGGGSKTVIGGNHDTPATALDLEYDGRAFAFSITLTDLQLQNLNVRLVSYYGDVSATNSRTDVYCVSVAITAINENYYFPKTTYYLYYRINKAKFDLSGIKWNYSDAYTYDGNAKNVRILGSTLPAGLSVSSYSGDLNMTDATEGTIKKYVTSVQFTIANSNYTRPVQTDSDSYRGTFNWSQEWEINKKEIDVQWKNVMTVQNDQIFYVPVLVDGDEKVDYKYEILDEETKTFLPIPYISKLPGKAVTYRVTATLKTGLNGGTDYSKNYKLHIIDETNTNPYQFTVGEDQYAIVMHIEINGVAGDTFPYTGKGYQAVPVIDQDESGQITANEIKVTYYMENGTPTLTRLPDGTYPTKVGRYRVDVSLRYGISGTENSYIDGSGEFYFEIVKGELNTDGLVWALEHDGAIYTYNAVQNKWLDIYNAEVKEFAYDGVVYTLRLTGAAEGITLTGATTFNETDAGNYTATIAYSYDTDSWNEPKLAKDFKWTIAKQKIDATSMAWDYADSFEYALDDENNPVVYSVGLINIPEYLNGKITYTTDGNAGTSAYLSGAHSTQFTIGGVGDNYEIVLPETLNSTLTWNISKKRIRIPESRGGWTAYDAKSHDLLEVLGISGDWQKYFEMTVTCPEGESGADNKVSKSGTYSITFALKSGLNTSSLSNVVWDNGSTANQSTTFTVEKLTVTIAGWNANYADSTAIVEPTGLPADILTYSIQKEDGTEATETELQTGGLTLYVVPALNEAYADDVTLAFADDEYKTYSFVTDYPGLTRLDKPSMATTEVTFDGSSHTFAITNWDDYRDYLEICTVDDEGVYTVVGEDYLTQTNANTYNIVLRFKDGALASWKKSDGSNDIDKSDVSLSFEIKIRMIEIPALTDYGFTGSEINALGGFMTDYSSYVTVTGTTSAFNAGSYTFRISLKNPGSCLWTDGSSEALELNWNIEKHILASPDVSGWTVYDGDIHNLVNDCGFESGWEQYFDITVLEQYTYEDEEGNTVTDFREYAGYSGDKYRAISSGVYRLTFKIKSSLNSGANNVVWDDDTTEEKTVTMAVSKYSITVESWNKNKENSTVNLSNGTIVDKFFEYRIWKIETGEDETEQTVYVSAADVATAGEGITFYVGIFVKESYVKDVEISYANDGLETYSFITSRIQIDKPSIRIDSVEFDGNPYTFVITNWDNISNYLEVNGDSLTQTNAGTYTVTVSFKAGAVAEWRTGGTSDLLLTFTVTEREITKPAISNLPYTGSEQNVFASQISAYEDYVTVVSGDKGTDAGDYTLVLRLKYPESTRWANGDTRDLQLKWKIEQNKLATPAYGGGNIGFDGAEHDVLKMCGVPEDYSTYYTVKVEYSADGTAFAAFEGTKLTNAGKYKVTFTIKTELNPDGASNIVWADGSKTALVIEMEIEKLQLSVTGWNADEGDSIAIIDAENYEGYVEYVIRNSDGIEVTKDTVASAADGSEFTVELKINGSYAGNVELVFADGVESKYSFKLGEEPDVPQPPAELEKPKIAVDMMTYDGTAKTFIIVDWAETYSEYLEIASGSLMQTRVGTYTVTLRFKEGANATWVDGSTDDVVLSFEIVEKQITRITRPHLVVSSIEYDGMSHTFEIAEWDNYYSAYLEVTYGLTQTNVGKYSVTVSFKAGANATWVDETSEAYTLNFEIYEKVIVGPSEPQIKLSKPQVDLSTVKIEDGNVTFEMLDWEGFEDYIEIVEDSLKEIEEGKYSVVLRFKADVDATWMDGTTDDYTLTFTVPKTPDIPDIPEPEVVTLSKPRWEKSTLTYNGSAQTFVIADWDYYADYLENVQGAEYLTQTEVGSYTVTLRFKDGVKATWMDGTTTAFNLTFNIEKAPVTGVWTTNTNGKPEFNVGGELPEEVYDIVIKDSNGNVVNGELEKDVQYYATVGIDNEYAAKYNLADSVVDTFAFYMDENGVVKAGGIPGNNNPSGGNQGGNQGGNNQGTNTPAGSVTDDAPSSIVWISAGLGVVLVLFLIALIGIVFYVVKSRYKTTKKK